MGYPSIGTLRIKILNSYMLIFGIIPYIVGMILTVYPYRHNSLTNKYDFGVYALTQIYFALCLTYLYQIKPHLKSSKFLYRTIIITGLSLRFIFLFSNGFTTDTLRYLSDGLAWLSNQNPYHISPYIQGLPYSHLNTIYPILSELLFSMIAYIYPSTSSFKLFAGLCELMLLHQLYIYYIKTSKLEGDKIFLLFFACLNPLTIFECFSEGHIEILSVACFLGASHYYFNTTSQPNSTTTRWMWLSFMSFLTKLHGILFMPFILCWPCKTYFMQQRITLSLKQWLLRVLLCSIVLCMGFLPFYQYGTETAQSGFYMYFNYWTFNHVISSLLQIWLAQNTVIMILQGIIIAIYLILFILWWLNIYSDQRYMGMMIATLLCFFPVQHPWYYLLGFYLVFFIKEYQFFTMLVCSTIGISYLAYTDYNSPWLTIAHWVIASMLFLLGQKKNNTHQLQQL